MADEVLERKLTDEELEKIADKVGDYFSDWFERIEFAINNVLNQFDL